MMCVCVCVCVCVFVCVVYIYYIILYYIILYDIHICTYSKPFGAWRLKHCHPYTTHELTLLTNSPFGAGV